LFVGNKGCGIGNGKGSSTRVSAAVRRDADLRLNKLKADYVAHCLRSPGALFYVRLSVPVQVIAWKDSPTTCK